MECGGVKIAFLDASNLFVRLDDVYAEGPPLPYSGTDKSIAMPSARMRCSL
jgi:hypothetical protein